LRYSSSGTQVQPMWVWLQLPRFRRAECLLLAARPERAGALFVRRPADGAGRRGRFQGHMPRYLRPTYGSITSQIVVCRHNMRLPGCRGGSPPLRAITSVVIDAAVADLQVSLDKHRGDIMTDIVSRRRMR
jgi:hypothetical protein